MEPQQTVLSPAGTEAQSTALLSWVMFGGATVIFVGVMLLAALACAGSSALRRRLSANIFIVGAGAVFPAVALAALLIYGLMLTGARAVMPGNSMRIEITGEQWWWRVKYPAPAAPEGIATANEARIPVGSDIEITLSSADVIHSLWVPSLAGKVDMIPGTMNRMRLRATRPVFFAANAPNIAAVLTRLMAFHVVALEPGIRGLASGQGEPAVATATVLLRQGAACSCRRAAAAAMPFAAPRLPARSAQISPMSADD